MGSIKRGWALTGQSWRVLKSDLSPLMIFPLLSTVFAILATAAIWAPTLIVRGVFDGQQVDSRDPIFYIAGLATAYLSTFIAIFFNVALAACAVRSMRGEDTKVSEGVIAAMHRLGPILGWTFVATTVGLILRALEERLPLLGKIAVWLTGAAWAIATFFVVPVVALEGTGPIASLKRSAAVVKARWGESATGAATITVVIWLVSIAIVVAGAGGAIGFLAIGQPVLAAVVVAITVAAIIIVSLISSALGQIFRVAVYQYAVSGQAPVGFDGQLLQAAFQRR
ncbi:hypothetical protein MB901379_01240 [Mycobacterium basiliense]|uniref:Glycerophosphoryl diester phosphodiesterase membrane domain-containing protein n=1 Tax=Mycobacterium basiliense TaxID=2094119 RepID=A0A447GB55_9MYCO|nr:DUF6159 family protein [Mycobacterium basiliense]VDM87696.1 hypothetical protein MB901379_01240 [Mycobacterium basiliense]